MNPDRATLSFLNGFPEPAREKGKQMHDRGCVTQIFGNHLFIQARVEDDEIHRTSLRLQGNEWTGECNAENEETRNACLYATMLARMERGENLPESPNEVDDKRLSDLLEEKLERALEEEEELFLEKIEKRFRRYEMEQEIYDHDLVRLNSKWEITGYDPLKLWPVPPRDIIEFWNYIAYAFRKKNFKYPDFMAPITDLDATEQKMGVWEKEHEILTWRNQVQRYVSAAPAEDVESIELRLIVTTNEAKLQYRAGDEKEFQLLSQKGDLSRLMERFEEGGLLMDAASELIWGALIQNWNVTDDLRFRFDSEETCRLFNRLFQQEELQGALMTLDEEPFARVDERLRWVCVNAESDGETIALQLETAEGEPVTHVMRVLPGTEDLYLSDEGIFQGPKSWIEDTEILPRYEIPRDVLESESGVEFLARLEVELPEYLRKRVQDEVLQVHLNMSLSPNITAAQSEHLIVQVTASDIRGTRQEKLDKDGWTLVEQQSGGRSKIMRYNRNILHRFPRWLEPMMLVYDANLDGFKARVTRNFPERFAEWIKGFTEDVIVEADETLESLMRDPVKASVSFEVVEKEIDWFDLKVIVNVEGLNLTQDEIRSLVSARGGFVRMKEGGWLRLEIDMEERQKEAVERLGLDPFDLTGESHRMHVLQLAEPLAKEVFDAEAWENVCKRAASIKLQVRPRLPKGLNVTLRPYQIEGFHYLAYLSTNHFGGILADDMGLGKTVQGLAWLLWLRSRNDGGGEKPSLVVCPKSVLDVWAGEVQKFAPGLRVQVLRNKTELDLDVLDKEVDLLVVNYSQLRVCAEKLTGVHWLAIILDEGQQIKNPDSKAAKIARQLQGENRLVLTGTPIENRLLDIWSLMAFSMPGVLGNRKYFREHFDRRKDPGSQVRLAARLRPFLLRRTKGQVAMDLPPRTEEDVLCLMEGVQEELYNAELVRIQEILLRVKTEDALNKDRFIILQGLMRLRQICCHPGLIDSKHLKAESAKLTALFYLLDQLREEGHKVLVFSQFVTMLNIIREKMEEEQRPFHYLTGQTKDRHAVIEGFQTTKDPSVFLLSLKAGGSGLNLTAASYVVLYDPWWNPAVESQAIDRTHRIGQKSNVIAYRLLMRSSVEEKIRTLQAQKQEMTAGVLGEEGFTRNLRIKDLEYIFSLGGNEGAESDAVELAAEDL